MHSIGSPQVQEKLPMFDDVFIIIYSLQKPLFFLR
jgi:hypothetical protein